ncbi:NAD-dependent epimerase/dehydratase family protein [Rhizomicrobium electricum]|jgi:UDP-glucuronate 4-epimerase|uniref:NAD-dependent epimerase n=1 Tax=Rhizomicrobium electricum TaxID=480070 RepID=A0ABP3PKI7_9PROT|nr:NAD-dependent epimerase/dehydratase family protein [Rhizomicrobium electricum]NIJ46992.1 UDP-glucuronate 4-epimerase [Rhizomicrobium electricum]
MSVLVTGAAGFIGSHVCHALLARGETVTGVDCINDYYDVKLKEARLARLTERKGFRFLKLDFSDRDAMMTLADEDISHIVHLGAQPGVRYSLTNPYAYITANVMGHVVVLELARRLRMLKNVVYASSSSVYGGNTKLPFTVGDPVETPVSLYAATKRSDELISHTYAHLYGIPQIGLRFFTVYGPWGRPDMAPFLFTRAMLAGEEIRVFNNGEMWRDFTYIDDIVAGVVAAMDTPPALKPPHKVYNIGNNNSEKLTDFIAALESALGIKAKMRFEPMQPGDVVSTYADIEDTKRELGFAPTTPIAVGVPKFVGWYRDFYKV